MEVDAAMKGVQNIFILFGVMAGVSFLVTLAVIILIVVLVLKRKKANDRAPRLAVDAKVVSRRSDHSISRTSSTGSMHSTTWHYVTFEVESGDRLEFSVSGQEYGMLMEGDIGKLTFQGTRYLGFDRFR